MAGTGVSVAAGHPGMIETPLIKNDLATVLLHRAAPILPTFAKSVQEGVANTFCMAVHDLPRPPVDATAEEMAKRLYWSDCQAVAVGSGRVHAGLVQNEQSASALWARSEELIAATYHGGVHKA